MCEPVRTEFK